MSDALRSPGNSGSHETRAQDGVPGAECDAKIEQLLLVGLDHYFAAEYDQAINVWTRALFLDRSHPRARAYIERARSALAERQRESEELLQNGVAAFHRGESDEARRLLQAAIEGGAPSDEALAVLDRLNRLETGAASSQPARSRTAPPRTAPQKPAGRSRSALRVVAAMALTAPVAIAGLYVATGRTSMEWRSVFALQNAPARSAASALARDQRLPLPRRGETALSRARALAASGRLHDALSTLDLVRVTDAQKPDADRLRADIQRQLLALTSATAPASSDRRAP